MVSLDYFRKRCSADVTVEGRYERCEWPNGKPYWLLRFWKVSFVGKNGYSEGTWHKIHGNKRNDIGFLKLLLDSPPTVDE